MLSRGLISGHWPKRRGRDGDFRAHGPRFQGENLDTNLALVEALRAVAEAKGVTVAQVAIAWVAGAGRRHRAGTVPDPMHAGGKTSRRHAFPQFRLWRLRGEKSGELC